MRARAPTHAHSHTHTCAHIRMYTHKHIHKDIFVYTQAQAQTWKEAYLVWKTAYWYAIWCDRRCVHISCLYAISPVYMHMSAVTPHGISAVCCVWQQMCDRRYGGVTGDMDSFMWQQIWSLTPCVTGVLHHMWQEIWTLSRLHIQDASALTRSPPFDAPQRHFLSDHAVRCLSATLCEYKIKHTQFTKWIYIYICIYIHIYVYIYYIYIR